MSEHQQAMPEDPDPKDPDELLQAAMTLGGQADPSDDELQGPALAEFLRRHGLQLQEDGAVDIGSAATPIHSVHVVEPERGQAQARAERDRKEASRVWRSWCAFCAVAIVGVGIAVGVTLCTPDVVTFGGRNGRIGKVHFGWPVCFVVLTRNWKPITNIHVESWDWEGGVSLHPDPSGFFLSPAFFCLLWWATAIWVSSKLTNSILGFASINVSEMLACHLVIAALIAFVVLTQ